MKKRTVNRRVKKAAERRPKSSTRATRSIVHPLLGELHYEHLTWKVRELQDFGVLGTLPVFVEGTIDSSPNEHQLAALKRLKRGPVGIRKSLARGLRDELEVAEIDDDELAKYPVKKNDDIWKYCRISSVWLKEELAVVMLEIHVNWDHHTCNATIRNGRVQSVIVS